MEIERLVVGLPNDSFGALELLTQEQLKTYEITRDKSQIERINRIKHEAGLAPYLLALADKYIAQPGRDGLPMIFKAIASRDDIPQAKIKRFLDLASVVIAKPNTLPQPLSDDFLIGMTSVMAAHRSPENEAMLISILRLREDPTGILLKLSAGEALAVCGSTKVLPSMNETSQWFAEFVRKTEGRKSSVDDANMFDRYIEQLKKRVNSAGGFFFPLNR